MSHAYTKAEKPQTDLFLSLTTLLPQLRWESSNSDQHGVWYESCPVIMQKAPDGRSRDLVLVQSLLLRMNVAVASCLLFVCEMKGLD